MDKLMDALREVDVGKGIAYEQCLCKKLVAIPECRRVYSGVVNYTEILCPDCRRELSEHSRIVCLGCKRLSAFLPPQRHACGFVFERGKHYHIESCCYCEEGRRAFPVLELLRHAKAAGLRTDPNPDIVRDAERIVLPADNEFYRMAMRFNNRDQQP